MNDARPPLFVAVVFAMVFTIVLGVAVAGIAAVISAHDVAATLISAVILAYWFHLLVLSRQAAIPSPHTAILAARAPPRPRHTPPGSCEGLPEAIGQATCSFGTHREALLMPRAGLAAMTGVGRASSGALLAK